MYNYDIKYTIKSVKCKDGKIVYKLYENNNLVQQFSSYKNAVEYRDYYKRMMR